MRRWSLLLIVVAGACASEGVISDDELGEARTDPPSFDFDADGGTDATDDATLELDASTEELEGSPDSPDAGAEPAPEPQREGYYLPLACGTSARVSQGNDGALSHHGLSRYAFDFSLARGTAVRAMADGTVRRAVAATGPGDPCYEGGGPECAASANYVHLLHPDGTRTIYVHLQRVLVRRGDRVRRGDLIGRSGMTGYATGPHLHVARTERCGDIVCQSVRMRFRDVRGDGVPETGDRVTSGNCT